MSSIRDYRCAWCGTQRPPADLLAFWPLKDARDIRFVCRPALAGSCFSRVVGPAFVHTIAPAETLEVRA